MADAVEDQLLTWNNISARGGVLFVGGYVLFNSYLFLFAFFPLALLTYFVAARFGERWRLVAILFASLIFYGYWDVRFLALLVGSILWNFFLGTVLTHAVAHKKPYARILLAAGVAVDLAVLGIFKYAHFFVENYDTLSGDNIVLGKIILPLGISFFTFEQIGYLVDIWRGRLFKIDLLRFSVFVSFFPRLVAGPILRYSEILPQLNDQDQGRAPVEDLSVGLTIFFIGLAKKSILADGIAPYANLGFAAAAGHTPIDFFAAWGAMLAYTCQLYFDFSGYSDMAIGSARCFGVHFPANFNSPYKSQNIIEFWRRWHMTLSRFLRDYLYISLGGNRKGEIRRYANLMITMLLGGLWHGANWTFVVWGGLHGTYLMINHAWNALYRRLGLARRESSKIGGLAAVALTFLAVNIAWVFFRSPNFGAALNLLAGLIGMHGAVLPNAYAGLLHPLLPALQQLGIVFNVNGGAAMLQQWLWIAALLVIAFLAPNTQQILNRYDPVLNVDGDQTSLVPESWRWALSPRYAVAAGILAFLAIGSVTKVSEFLYWQF